MIRFRDMVAAIFIIICLDPKMPLFQILAFGVVGIGGLVGGVVGALLPRISSGVSAGFLASVFICAVSNCIHVKRDVSRKCQNTYFS